MTKEAWVALVSAVISFMVGAGIAFTVLKVDDAIIQTRVSQLESSSQQHQSDINILRVEVSKNGTEIKNTDESYKLLRETLKEVAESTKDVAIALTRIEVRQANTDKILEKLTEKLKISVE